MIGGKVFYFGPKQGIFSKQDRAKAERMATALETAWQHQQANGGGNVWRDDVIEAALAFGRGGIAEQVPPLAVPIPTTTAANAHQKAIQASGASARASVAPIPPKPSGVHLVGKVASGTIGQAIDAYLLNLDVKKRSGQIGDDHHHILSHQYKALKALRLTTAEGRKINFADVAVADADFDLLTAVVGHYTARPISPKTNRPIAPSYAKDYIDAVADLFDYLDRTDNWQGFKRWTEVFDVKIKATPREMKKAAKGIPNFTLDELRYVWHQATSKARRVYLMLGLCCGFTQKEIASLMKDDLVLEGGQWFIDRLRNKTGVRGKWWLPPLLATELREIISTTPDNTDGLAMLTGYGLPLVHASNGKKGRVDTVKLAWARMADKAKTMATRQGVNWQGLSFKYLRKTASQYVRDQYGLEVAQAFLAHSPDTVAGKHYNNVDFRKVAEAGKGLWEWLAPMRERLTAKEQGERIIISRKKVAQEAAA